MNPLDELFELHLTRNAELLAFSALDLLSSRTLRSHGGWRLDLLAEQVYVVRYHHGLAYMRPGAPLLCVSKTLDGAEKFWREHVEGGMR